jgi:hypothetical protein
MLVRRPIGDCRGTASMATGIQTQHSAASPARPRCKIGTQQMRSRLGTIVHRDHPTQDYSNTAVQCSCCPD